MERRSQPSPEAEAGSSSSGRALTDCRSYRGRRGTKKGKTPPNPALIPTPAGTRQSINPVCATAQRRGRGFPWNDETPMRRPGCCCGASLLLATFLLHLSDVGNGDRGCSAKPEALLKSVPTKWAFHSPQVG